ncbi:MAG: hypothetical protein E6I63_10905 [Chloroflexi bacterium]|nr:MAG: hypothetical protein E6I63_10905 [Chloroflexota bacterium]
MAALLPTPAGAQSSSPYHPLAAGERVISGRLGAAHLVHLPSRSSQAPSAPVGPVHPLIRPRSLTAPASSAPAGPTSPETTVKAAPTDQTLFRTSALSSAAIPTKDTILEPSVSNNQNVVFYTANWSAAVSTDAGATFTYINPFTDLPPAAAGFCCDQVTIYDPHYDITIWELQYLANGVGNVQRLAIANGRAGVAGNVWHYWDITAQDVGAPAGHWLDFPRLALSNNYLYLSTNDVAPSGAFYDETLLLRLPLSALANPASTPTFTGFGSTIADVFEPVSGATDTMYFGAHVATTMFRVYRWAETGVPQVAPNITHPAYVDENGDGLCPSPDTFNMCGRSDSRVAAGWLAGGTLGFLWAGKQGVAGTQTFPFPYIQGIRITADSAALVDNPQIFSSNYAYQYPDVAVNAVGALGLSLVYGGGTVYPTSAIGIMDDVSPSVFSLMPVRSGDHGPSNNAWGDYLTVRPASGNGLTWVGTSYTLQGGTAGSSVEPRFLWFGRLRDDPFKPSVTGLGVAAMIGVSTGTAATADFTGPSGNAADYTTSINWGDGSSTQPGTIAGMGTAFSVTGSHTYTAMGRFTVATTVSDSFASTTVTSTATVLTDTSGTYRPVVPARILDTRSGAPFGPNTTREVQVGGFPGSGVPATGISAVVLNVTVTNTTAPSFMTLFPDSALRPLASNLNWTAGVTIPNLVEVAVGLSSTNAPGYISVFNNQGNADVIIDVEGYVTDHASSSGPDGLFNPLVPARILDTRAGPTPVKLGAQSTLPVALLGNGGVPSGGVEAVVLNVTVTNPTVPSFLTVWPDGDPKPKASNLNFDAGQTIPNRVIVKLGMGGKVDIFNNAGTVDVIADAGGWYTDATAGGTGLRFQGVTPYRVLDTRPMTKVGPYATPIQPQSSIPVQVAGTIGGGATPNSAQAVVTNVTVTDTTGPSFLTVWPDGTSRPLASDLNWTTGVTIPNLVVVKLGSLGRVDAFNNVGTTDLVVDVVGFYI